MAGISITLGGNFAKLDELKDKSKRTADSIKNAFGSGMVKGLVGGVSLAATFTGLAASVKKAVDRGGELVDMMAKTGAEGKGLLIMQRAFENAGLAADMVPAALNKMQKALAGVNEEGEPTNEAFGRLGLSVEELMKLDPVDAFKRIQMAIASIQNPAERTAVAMEIFGRSGGNLLAVMTDEGAFAAARGQVGSLGDTLVENAERFDAIGDSLDQFGLKADQLGSRLAVGVLPALEWMAELMDAIDLGTIDLSNPFSTTLDDGDKARAAILAADWEQDAMEKAEAEAARANASKDPWAEPDEKGRAKADKEWAEKTKLLDKRAAMQAEFTLEMDLLRAKRTGDAQRVAALEREKSIREEIRKLEAAGFVGMEASDMAAAKVDAELAAKEAEERRKQDKEAKQKKSEDLADRLNDVRKKQEDMEYESSIGAISDMQRIGGGGGAVASGLDYQRQATDLQRETNQLLRQLISTVSTPLD